MNRSIDGTLHHIVITVPNLSFPPVCSIVLPVTRLWRRPPYSSLAFRTIGASSCVVSSAEGRVQHPLPPFVP
jgi:hypothetical protein